MAWCSTATYSDGSHVADVGAWGECADTCAACQVRERHVVTRMIVLHTAQVVSGPAAGQTCVFPFTWR